MSKSTGRGGGLKRAALTVLFFAVVFPVQAGEFAYGIGYSATHSDNITRASAAIDERSEIIHSYLAGFAFIENTSTVIARVLAQAELRDYQDDIFGDETLFNMKSSLLWELSPRRFTWTVDDTYEQTRISAAVADTPDNRANVNVFSTGPDVYIRFSPVQTLALGARAGNVYTGRANADSDRFSGSARWLYQATSSNIYSLNYEVLDVNYDDDTLNSNYSSHAIFLRADYRPSRSQYTIDLGATKINTDRGQDLDGTLARFSWLRQLTSDSNFGMSASGEFRDAGADILTASSATTPSAALTSGEITSDVYYVKRGSLFYNRRGARFGMELSLYTQDLDYETTLQDRKETGGLLNLVFFLSGTTSVTLSTDQIRSEYRDFVRRDTDRDSGIRLDYRMTRSVTLALEGRREDRSSTIPAAEYVDNRVYFSILYRSSPLFTPVTTR
jgi:hypothetical protein